VGQRLLGRVLLAGEARAAQHRLHPAAELAERERLGDVVVGPELQAQDLVDLLGLGGQHDDRHAAARPQTPADLEAVDLGQHQVEHDEVDRALVEAVEGLLAVLGADHVIDLSPERKGQQLLDRLLVVDEEDPRCLLRHAQIVGCSDGEEADPPEDDDLGR